MTLNDQELAAAIEAISLQAGTAIMEIYGRHFSVETKVDDSPVTEADQAAETIIVTALRVLTPKIPVVAEEEVAAGHQPDIGEGPFWLVDPLDGTREFILDEAIVNGRGRMRVDDGIWTVEGTDLPAGSKVRVTEVSGATLRVASSLDT